MMFYMKRMSQIAVGQPETAVQPTDKWALLAALTEAAEDVGVNHRTLSVLRALLTFYPDRILPCGPGCAVVFPSNATLSKRLNGMPESTLRRHLAVLVQTGLVARQDSPNRKRFARRYGLAFGFDLSPLARAAQDLVNAADSARERQRQVAALRDRLAFVRAQLLNEADVTQNHEWLETARLVLRRKTNIQTLQALLTKLESLLKTPITTPPVSEKMSGSHIENERHIQGTNKKNIVRKTSTDPDRTGPKSQTVSLGDVLENCKEYACYFPKATSDWSGLISVSNQLHSMIGIERPIYDFALQRLGPNMTATIMLCMLEKIGQIKNPGAYLRGLVRRAETGSLNLRAMVFGCQLRKLSADNFA
ncbi:plasmid replication protein RepC [Phaeobacter sp. J2-8]|uniref:plasmid replication protein RepC n=1 Tax=Phaeobacter sp. J2-8 TaxID=2931394 RepID=UPI001FD359B0|nr:replication initiation protein RepC [Phaeobacter sp. J2-8]